MKPWDLLLLLHTAPRFFISLVFSAFVFSPLPDFWHIVGSEISPNISSGHLNSIWVCFLNLRKHFWTFALAFLIVSMEISQFSWELFYSVYIYCKYGRVLNTYEDGSCFALQVAVNEVSSQPQLGDQAIDNSEEYREMMTSLGDRLSVHSKQVLYQRMMNIHFMHHLVHQFQSQDFSLVMKNLGIFSLITVSLESWLHHPLGIQLHLVTQQPEARPSVGEQILLEDHNFCKIHIQSLNPKP